MLPQLVHKPADANDLKSIAPYYDYNFEKNLFTQLRKHITNTYIKPYKTESNRSHEHEISDITQAVIPHIPSELITPSFAVNISRCKHCHYVFDVKIEGMSCRCHPYRQNDYKYNHIHILYNRTYHERMIVVFERFHISEIDSNTAKMEVFIFYRWLCTDCNLEPKFDFNNYVFNLESVAPPMLPEAIESIKQQFTFLCSMQTVPFACGPSLHKAPTDDFIFVPSGHVCKTIHSIIYHSILNTPLPEPYHIIPDELNVLHHFDGTDAMYFKVSSKSNVLASN